MTTFETLVTLDKPEPMHWCTVPPFRTIDEEPVIDPTVFSVEFISPEDAGEAGNAELMLSGGVVVDVDFEEPTRLTRLALPVIDLAKRGERPKFELWSEKARTSAQEILGDQFGQVESRLLNQFEGPMDLEPPNLEAIGKRAILREIQRPPDLIDIPSHFDGSVFTADFVREPVPPDFITRDRLEPSADQIVHEAFIDATVADRAKSARWWVTDDFGLVVQVETPKPVTLHNDQELNIVALQMPNKKVFAMNMFMHATGSSSLQAENSVGLMKTSPDEDLMVVVGDIQSLPVPALAFTGHLNHDHSKLDEATMQSEIDRRARVIALRQRILAKQGVEPTLNEVNILRTDCHRSCWIGNLRSMMPGWVKPSMRRQLSW